MIEFLNVLAAALAGLVLGAAGHSAWLHSKKRGELSNRVRIPLVWWPVKTELLQRFLKLAEWKQKILLEDLECALENRLKVLERA